jgi:cell division protein ZapA
MGNVFPIHVLGTSFAIQTDESPEYVEKLVNYVKAKIEVLQKSLDTKDSMRILVIASVLIADELHKERETRSLSVEGIDELEGMTEEIIAKLDRALDVNQ